MNAHEPSERCKEIFAVLSEYLDMELPPDSCQELESHLEGCRPCIEFVESLRKSIDLCREYSPTELPKPLSEEARHELQEAYEKMLSARKSRQ
jgi:anti-sigma factor RsiW